MKKSGFTLIEMSIVLVIIGLIVGGILTGRDLISAAAQRAQISQIQKYNVALRTFQNKYGGLPGDLAVNLATQFGFTVTNCAGTTGQRDGNGLIDGYWGGVGATWILQGYQETELFWVDLSQAGLIDGAFPNGGATNTDCNDAVTITLSPGTTYVGDYFPAGKIGNGAFVYVYEGDNVTYTGGDPVLGGTTVGGDNWFGLSAITSCANGVGGGEYSNPALTVAQAYNIDKKIDDGKPTTGSVRAMYLTNWVIDTGSENSDSATSCYNANTKTYSTSVNGDNGLNCGLSFKFQ